ncbi:hypothetical protein SLEP1_g57526 [Rubroshorea leprosula]|uniref:Uncharacterized protein n=1 Tax=Rubroshorea leprosula TaxID=152421 RepID=A0AAV5MLI9_9ROSI|nr:hypothetical protein SLEP1_g57526 [Rubroshorea leprosula]
MATHQASFLGMLFLILLFTSGPAPAQGLGPEICLGLCKNAQPDCHTFCVSRGFPKGGACLKLGESEFICCCNNWTTD